MYRDYIIKELEKRNLMVNFTNLTVYKKRGKIFDGYKKLISFKDEKSLMGHIEQEYDIQSIYLYMFVNSPEHLYKDDTGKFAKKEVWNAKANRMESVVSSDYVNWLEEMIY